MFIETSDFDCLSPLQYQGFVFLLHGDALCPTIDCIQLLFPTRALSPNPQLGGAQVAQAISKFQRIFRKKLQQRKLLAGISQVEAIDMPQHITPLETFLAKLTMLHDDVSELLVQREADLETIIFDQAEKDRNDMNRFHTRDERISKFTHNNLELHHRRMKSTDRAIQAVDQALLDARSSHGDTNTSGMVCMRSHCCWC